MSQTNAMLLVKLRRDLAAGDARRTREQAGLSCQEVADAIKASESAVSRWERGQRIPRGDVALRYAKLLVALSDLTPKREASA